MYYEYHKAKMMLMIVRSNFEQTVDRQINFFIVVLIKLLHLVILFGGCQKI